MLGEAFPKFINPSTLKNDFIVYDFITKEFCDFIIQAIQEQEWTSNHGDRYKTRDVLLEDSMPDLFGQLNTHLDQRIWPWAQHYWDIDEFATDTIFAIKYHMDGQRSLDLHHDESFISGSVKLCDSYTGGLLEFPRQKFSNKDVGVGQLLTWPSKITHPHRSTPITSGTKYSLTIWTKELNG